MKIKALLLGDYSHAPYHPLTGIDEKLKDILDDSFEIFSSEDYNILSQDLSEFKLIISYTDSWDSTLSDSGTAGLLSFVAKGGGFLLIHNGISLSKRHEIKSMSGASFIRHPDAALLSFQVDDKHPISKGISNFHMHEEPYQYDFCSHIEPEVFLTYYYDNKLWLSGWNLNFGQGKVVCLHPGHEAKVFDNANYRQIIANSAHWCVD